VIAKPKSTRTNISTTDRVGAAMLATVGIAGIGTNPAHAADRRVPFIASYSGRAMFNSEATVSFDRTGIATHLGLSDHHADITIPGPTAAVPAGSPTPTSKH
jgi:hypothetical protein